MKTMIYARDEDCIRNGSFYIERRDKSVAHYMNGDFMGFVNVDTAPYVPGLMAYEYRKVKPLLPSCFRK
jgi:hypothetical protein